MNCLIISVYFRNTLNIKVNIEHVQECVCVSVYVRVCSVSACVYPTIHNEKIIMMSQKTIYTQNYVNNTRRYTEGIICVSTIVCVQSVYL